MNKTPPVQLMDQPVDAGRAEMQPCADLGSRHGTCVQAFKNAVTVLDREFVHAGNFREAARCWQMGLRDLGVKDQKPGERMNAPWQAALEMAIKGGKRPRRDGG